MIAGGGRLRSDDSCLFIRLALLEKKKSHSVGKAWGPGRVWGQITHTRGREPLSQVSSKTSPLAAHRSGFFYLSSAINHS